jgi:hypothetical protein
MYCGVALASKISAPNCIATGLGYRTREFANVIRVTFLYSKFCANEFARASRFAFSKLILTKKIRSAKWLRRK